MLRPLNTVPHVVVTPSHKIISLLLHNHNFVTVMDCNVNIDYLTLWRVAPYRLRTSGLEEQIIKWRSNKERELGGSRVVRNGLNVQYVPVRKCLTIK